MGNQEKWEKQVRETFTEQDVKMMDYALAYVKKAGIAQFEKDLQRIKQVFETGSHNPV